MTVTRAREIPPVTTLLFDLDNTLLAIDMPAFLKAYFSLAGRRFASPARLPRVTPALAAALRKMMTYRAGTEALDRVFLGAFSRAIKCHPTDVRMLLTAFHRAEFEQLRQLTSPLPAARPLLEKALSLGYELVIATNPVFFLDAVRARIRWAGLEGIPFSLITSAEVMRRAKPHRDYFAQTLRLLGRRADECLMVGDDPGMDLPAGVLGIGTWLAIPQPEECCHVPGADYRGTLGELDAWLDERGPAAGGRRPPKSPDTQRAGSQERSRAEQAESPSSAAAKPATSPAGPPATDHPPTADRTSHGARREIEVDLAAAAAQPRTRVLTLRSIIRAGHLQPSYRVWLWIRIMRALAEHHRANTVFGCINPDGIFIDGENNVRIVKPASSRQEYAAPEIQAGYPPGCHSDIYSMGVILRELFGGSCESAGKKRPAQPGAGIPLWLEELILRCTEREPTKRYRTTDEVSAALLKLKSAASAREIEHKIAVAGTGSTRTEENRQP